MRCKRLLVLPILLLAVCPSFAATTAETRPTVELACGDVRVRYTDCVIAPTNHIVADEIAERRVNGTLYEKAEMMDECLSSGSTYAYAVYYTFPRLKESVERLRAQIETPATDSKITFSPDKKPMFYITREQTGRALPEEEVCKDIYFAVKRACYRNADKVSVPLFTTSVKPTVTAAENTQITKLRARFTTDMSHSGENRKHNIALAMQKINGSVLRPGEEFSFNAVVGERSAANGFLEANIILDGEYVAGFGGGVCQASTTVYNCALSAGLRVTSARSHSLTPGYVPPSFDAMVNSGSSDLRFVNDGPTPVFIRAYCNGSTVITEIYGSAMTYRIERESVVVSRTPVPEDGEIVDTDRKYTAELETGAKVRVSYGKEGLTSEGYLNYYDAYGRLAKRVKIRTDKYAAHRGVVAVAP